AREHDAAAKMVLPVRLRLLPEDHGEVLDRVVLEAAPAERGRRAFAARLRERQVHEAVVREVRIERDVEQAALAFGEDVWDAFDRVRQLLAVEDPQLAGPLGDEQPAVRQERHSPGMVQPVRETLDVDRAALRLERAWLC